ncbi:hypothetical protein GCM10017774_37730 [Lentzea cavernae]|uniref:Uncharacterized protein n=1 Tax=Lentzea cavernae TaxID=2020703 RepID=A0ABQ3ME77_9PSEU|nr:hypothetical protein GCM10017774_37730 [Lentzea cavernae]
MLLTVLLTGWGLPPPRQCDVTVPPAAAGQTQTLEIPPRAEIRPNEPRWTLKRGCASRPAQSSSTTPAKTHPAGALTVMGGRTFGPLLLALAPLVIRARVKRRRKQLLNVHSKPERDKYADAHLHLRAEEGHDRSGVTRAETDHDAIVVRRTSTCGSRKIPPIAPMESPYCLVRRFQWRGASPPGG